MPKRILPFVRDSGVWIFHPSREKTRSACIEILGRLPGNVLDFIVDSRRLILIAPASGRAGCVQSLRVDAPSVASDPRFELIMLAPELEGADRARLIGLVVKFLAAAMRPFLIGSDATVTEMAALWGFSREISAASEWKARRG
jgi:hypothetical protein